MSLVCVPAGGKRVGGCLLPSFHIFAHLGKGVNVVFEFHLKIAIVIKKVLHGQKALIIPFYLVCTKKSELFSFKFIQTVLRSGLLTSLSIPDTSY